MLEDIHISSYTVLIFFVINDFNDLRVFSLYKITLNQIFEPCTLSERFAAMLFIVC